MVDIDAAMRYVVTHGDDIDRARLAWLTSGAEPDENTLDKAEAGQSDSGGWPAMANSAVGSIDATCFRLAELDDLGALKRQPARQALAWLASRRNERGRWEEHEALAGAAPPWARPGDAEATLYLTARVGLWLAVSGAPPGGVPTWTTPDEENEFLDVARSAAEVFTSEMRSDGSWPSYLAAGWCGGALLYYLGSYYESAQVQVALADRVPEMSAADVASTAAAMRRVGMSCDDWLIESARRRLGETQRADGGWDSDDGVLFDIHTTLTAIRAVR